MKTTSLLLAYLFFTLPILAQFNEQQLVRIDYENNNALTQLAVIPNSNWPEREYCFDPVNGRYIFSGFGLQEFAMHVVDVQTGELLSQVDFPAFNNAQGNPSFEYHTDFNLIYTLVPTGLNGLGVDLNSVDPETGIFTHISTVDFSISWNNTVTSLDDENDIYFMLHANAQTMWKIDITDGTVLDTKVIEGYFFRQMYFDPINKKLVALGKANGDEFMTIVDIDPVTLVLSNIRVIDGMTNTTTGMTQGDGMSAMDPEQQLFFQVGINNGDKLMVIDLEDGEILYSNPFTIGPGSGPDFMVKHGIEKIVYDTKNDQLLGLIRDDLLPSSVNPGDPVIGMSLYPNPTTGVLGLDWEVAGKQRIDLFNALGQKVRSIPINPSHLAIELNLADLANGIYTLAIYDLDQTVTVHKIQKL